MNRGGVVEVFTAKTVGQMLELGGSQSWLLNPERMKTIEYIVCTRNDDRQYDEECGPRFEPRNAAFLVGRVRSITKIEQRNGRDRYRVNFSEYAVLEEPIKNFRSGLMRNPVIYSDIAACKQRGLEIEHLNFTPMPDVPLETAPPATTSRTRPSQRVGLTIADAKEGLAAYFGVSPESIQITING